MPFSTITKGLTIKVPTRSTKNWDSTLLTDLFEKISEHDHTGSGNGSQITTTALADNSVDDRKVRLRNNQYLRGRNNADTGDIDILRVNSTDGIDLNVAVTATAGTIYDNEPGAAPTGLTAGKTYFQPNYILSSAITYTIVSGAFMMIPGFAQIDGTLIVEGELEVG